MTKRDDVDEIRKKVRRDLLAIDELRTRITELESEHNKLQADAAYRDASVSDELVELRNEIEELGIELDAVEQRIPHGRKILADAERERAERTLEQYIDEHRDAMREYAEKSLQMIDAQQDLRIAQDARDRARDRVAKLARIVRTLGGKTRVHEPNLVGSDERKIKELKRFLGDK